jgi:hypothetical protein
MRTPMITATIITALRFNNSVRLCFFGSTFNFEHSYTPLIAILFITLDFSYCPNSRAAFAKMRRYKLWEKGRHERDRVCVGEHKE